MKKPTKSELYDLVRKLECEVDIYELKYGKLTEQDHKEYPAKRMKANIFQANPLFSWLVANLGYSQALVNWHLNNE